MSEWDPHTYLKDITQDISHYDVLQEKLVEATSGVAARRILELGTGSGETTRRVLEAHRRARLHGIDSSKEMLVAAGTALSHLPVELELRRLEDPLPEGPWDLVVSALAVHHLVAVDKADLFGRVAAVLRPGGRFVLADVVVPEDPKDAVVPTEDGFDFPSTIDEQLSWMAAAGLHASLFWVHQDVAVLTGDLAS